MNKDLTKGEPSRVLWSFCLPLFGSIIFQQLYNIADSLIAGKFVGENALAAVGNSYEITLIFIAVAFGCNIGCSVIVSRYFGSGEIHNVKTAVYTTFLSGGILCLLLMGAGILGCDFMLGLIHTPAEIMADSRLYLLIYMLGLPFLFFYNIANILVDYLFVRFLAMGVAGVAWATFLCQGVSYILAIVVIFKRLSQMVSARKPRIFSLHIFGQIAAVAVPSILQQSFVSVGNIIIQSLINGYGAPVIAGYAAAIKLNNLVITSLTTLANGISNFASQNLGAGKYERIHSGFKAGLKMVFLLCIPIVIVYFLWGRWFVYLFMENPKGLAMDTGIQILRILSPFYFVVSVKLVADGALRGTSRMVQFMVSTFTDLILRVVLATVFSGAFGVIGIWCAWPVGWSVGTAVSLFFYSRAKKQWEKD